MVGSLVAFTCVLCTAAVLVQVAAFKWTRVGPYNVILQDIKPCSDVGTGVVQFNGNFTGTDKYIHDAALELGVPIDENFKLEVEMQQMTTGGYKHWGMDQKVQGCKELWAVGEDRIQKLALAAGVTIEGCPIPAGTYSIKKWETRMGPEKLVPVMHYSKYKAIVKMFYKGAKVGCETVYVEVVPKD